MAMLATISCHLSCSAGKGRPAVKLSLGGIKTHLIQMFFRLLCVCSNSFCVSVCVFLFYNLTGCQHPDKLTVYRLQAFIDFWFFWGGFFCYQGSRGVGEEGGGAH